MGIQEDARFLTEYNNGDLVSTGVSKQEADMTVERVVNIKIDDPIKKMKN